MGAGEDLMMYSEDSSKERRLNGEVPRRGKSSVLLGRFFNSN